MYLTNKQKQALSIIKEYGCAGKNQIKTLTKCTDKDINMLISQRYIEKHGDVLTVPAGKPDIRTLMSLEVLVHFSKDLKWHVKADFPYIITFHAGGKVYDVTAVTDDEIILGPAIERVKTENTIVVVQNVDIIGRLNIKRDVLYCTIKPLRWYRKEN